MWCDYCSGHRPDFSSYMYCRLRSLAYLTRSIVLSHHWTTGGAETLTHQHGCNYWQTFPTQCWESYNYSKCEKSFFVCNLVWKKKIENVVEKSLLLPDPLFIMAQNNNIMTLLWFLPGSVCTANLVFKSRWHDLPNMGSFSFLIIYYYTVNKNLAGRQSFCPRSLVLQYDVYTLINSHDIL